MTNTVKPSRQEMIDAIYEKIADKTLSFGCKIIIQYMNSDPEEEVTVTSVIGGSEFMRTTFYGIVHKDYIKQIIGHPVMIGDVMNYIYDELFVIITSKKIINVVNKNGEKIETREELDVNSDTAELLYFWKEKRKPIEEQLDRCIEFVYNLISK